MISVSEAQERLEETKKLLQEQLTELQASKVEVDEVMTSTKSKLYAKFGDNINLESIEGFD